MTTPTERTRALRWGWEFLQDMQNSGCLTQARQEQLTQLLQYYPSPDDIRKWSYAASNGDGFWRLLAIEQQDTSATQESQPVIRPPVSRDQYVNALEKAFSFFQGLLRDSSLSEALRRKLPYVLRHYPEYGFDALVPDENPASL